MRSHVIIEAAVAQAVLDRPSIQETTADDEELIKVFRRFAADITD